MLKLSLRLVNIQKNKQSVAEVDQSQDLEDFKGAKLNKYSKIIRQSLNSDRAKGFIPLKPYQSSETSSFRQRHKKSVTQPQQNSEPKSLRFLHSFYASQQKITKEEPKHTKKKKMVDKIMVVFDNSERKRTKKEEQFFVTRPTLKNHSFNESIFSQRATKLEKKSLYLTGQRHQHIQPKMSYVRQNQPNFQPGEALIVKKYLSIQSKSFRISK